MVEGRTAQQKAKMIEAVTAAVSDSLNVRPRAVTIIIHDVSKENWGEGGKPATEL